MLTAVKLQVKEGIDAVIVDNVLAIRKGLTGSDNNSAAKELIPTANGSIKSSNGVLGVPTLEHSLP